ncbi:hypothetical protein IMZ11_10965 [Microtetraspora sp. AC03309]|uniref:RICIN domain-containing protein n=1 Tax=Microtetraspora sp. AC03309 TaxID=2779376 RepID=UPI001E4BB64D|nr:RICIN domain-containing protein [Microtetraspora sp. AC03309]MCC5576156.1 hypothetical protein [Microtetraspora sp. AC03309]
MRIRLASAATVLAAAIPVALAAPASAAPSVPVRPGTYQIVNSEGACLRGEGGFNSKVLPGACDTRWILVPTGDGDSVMIRHATTGTCMSTALERIYPPMVATLPCEPGPRHTWIVGDTGDGRVTIARGLGYVTDFGPKRPAVLLGDSPDLHGKQSWTLQPA